MYELEERMPASELFDWIVFLQMERGDTGPHEVSTPASAEAFAMAMGARID